MKMLKVLLLVILIYFIFTTIFMWPTIVKINKVIYGPVLGTDYRGAIRHCWWVSYAFHHNLNWRFDTMMNYPFGDKYEWSILSPLWQLCAYPLAIIFNENVAFNILFMLSFILSGLTMFLLTYYVTRNYIASFIAGLIYSFCPYHFNKIWEHLGLALIEWLPLFVLFLLRLRQNKKLRDIFVCAVTFSLVVFTDYYYAYFMFLFVLAFMLFIIFYQWRLKLQSLIEKKWHVTRTMLKLDFEIIQRIIFACFLAFIFTLPATFPFFIKIVTKQDTELAMAEGFIRSFKYLFTHSARPLNYFLPASTHPLFGNITKSLFGSIFYGRNSTEQTLFLGFTSLILTFIAFRRWKCSRLTGQQKDEAFDFITGFFIFSGIFSFLFSMPPNFNLGIFKIYFPASFMYNFFPMFRAYARFGILVMLSVSVLAGIGVTFLLKSDKIRHRKIIISLIIASILFEFNNMPPFHYVDVNTVPEVYRWLSKQKGDFIIAEYPLEEAVSGEAYVELDYLFYQRIHEKRLLNGIAAPGTDAYVGKEKIMMIGNPDVASILNSLGVKYVIMHLARYREGTNKKAAEVIGEVPDLSKNKNFMLMKKFGDDEVYEVLKLQENSSLCSS